MEAMTAVLALLMVLLRVVPMHFLLEHSTFVVYG